MGNLKTDAVFRTTRATRARAAMRTGNLNWSYRKMCF